MSKNLSRLTPQMLRFIAALIEQGHDLWATRICEDLNAEAEAAQAAIPQADLDRLIREWHEWNGDPEEFIAGEPFCQVTVAMMACKVLLEGIADAMEAPAHD